VSKTGASYLVTMGPSNAVTTNRFVFLLGVSDSEELFGEPTP
jgi:hypothetical protein